MEALQSFIGLDSFNSAFTNYFSKVDSEVNGGALAGDYANAAGAISGGDNPSFNSLPSFRRNYVDGIRLNYNNGQFGIVGGIHNGYFTDSDHLNDGNIGLDIAASVMIIPGLEFRLGFGYENNDAYDASISSYNTWANTYNTELAKDLSSRRGPSTILPYATVFPQSDDISQFNAWLSYQTGGLTLALEFDI